MNSTLAISVIQSHCRNSRSRRTVLIQCQLLCATCCRDLNVTFWHPQIIPCTAWTLEETEIMYSTCLFYTGYEVGTDVESLTSGGMDRVRREAYEALPSTCCKVGCRKSDLVLMCWETLPTLSSSLCKMHLKYCFSEGLNYIETLKVKMVLKWTFEKCSDVVFQEILQMQKKKKIFI